ncbi:uncharacterized protein LOC101862480 [Aplysia californica]|uniref:Uncharacterized protein LOC101862480 n=1 Tax=Aplysia californica TaxID=6500 RepID=A0ABM0JFZ2_APLCA|nr:uncharacterized protein LOC101862480 [Aplysia californica]
MMLRICVFVLSFGVAVLTVTSAANVTPESTEHIFGPTGPSTGRAVNSEVDVDEENVLDPTTVLDGIRLRDLSYEELMFLLNNEDDLFVSEMDILALKKFVEKKVASRTSGGLRKKRAGVRALGVARGLFRGSTIGRLTTSGRSVTRNYETQGDFHTAVTHFNNLNPTDRSAFSGRISGFTGMVGNHRVTARDGSKFGAPTLEIRSPKAGGTTMVRKFRFTPSGVNR